MIYKIRSAFSCPPHISSQPLFVIIIDDISAFKKNSVVRYFFFFGFCVCIVSFLLVFLSFVSNQGVLAAGQF